MMWTKILFAISLVLALDGVCLAQAPNWIQKLPATSPSAREYHAMTYDVARQQVVVFGGLPNSVNSLNDTWVWNGANWTQKLPASSPPARFGHAMAYDAARQNAVMFGTASFGAGGALNDTWVWDGVNWIQKFPPAGRPSPRAHCAMAYDAARGEVVLFGGFDGTQNLNQTWAWDGTNWTQKSPAPITALKADQPVFLSVSGPIAVSLVDPPARQAHGMAYDAIRSEVVLFGGLTASDALNDTWVWDGTNWTQKLPVNSPPPMYGHRMAWDSARGQVLLLGPASNGAPATWTWDGVNWTSANPASSPNASLAHGLADDAARGQVVLFGGGGQFGSFLEETWVWTANHPPVANTGLDRGVECTSPAGAVVTLNGLGSSDPDGDPLTYTWTVRLGEGDVTLTGPTPSITLPVGVYAITLVVSDGKVNSPPDTAVVTVGDTRAPALSVSLAPNVLWPPNHQLVPISATVQASDTCTANPSVTLLSITSNEPDNGSGDGDQPNDIQDAAFGSKDTSFSLRAERSASGLGRSYTVTYKATDASGNATTATAVVTVPLNQSQ